MIFEVSMWSAKYPYDLNSIQMVYTVSDDLVSVWMISKMSRSSVKCAFHHKCTSEYKFRFFLSLVLKSKILYYALLWQTKQCCCLRIQVLSGTNLRGKYRCAESFRFFLLCKLLSWPLFWTRGAGGRLLWLDSSGFAMWGKLNTLWSFNFKF